MSAVSDQCLLLTMIFVLHPFPQSNPSNWKCNITNKLGHSGKQYIYSRVGGGGSCKGSKISEIKERL